MKPKHRDRILITLSVALAAATIWIFLRSHIRGEKPEPGGAESVSAAVSAYFSERPRAFPAISGEKIEKRPALASPDLAAASLSPIQRVRLLELMNVGTRRELLEIYGIGKTRAEAIEAARPFDSLEQVAAVNGIGKVTFANVVEFGKTLGKRETVVAAVPPSMR